MRWNGSSCGSPHTHTLSLFSSSRRGLVSSARLCENFDSWFIIPRKRRMSPTLFGVRTCVITATFPGSGWMSILSMTCPRNLTDVCENLQFSLLSVDPAACSVERTRVSVSSCCSCIFLCTSTSSIMHKTPGIPSSMLDIRH